MSLWHGYNNTVSLSLSLWFDSHVNAFVVPFMDMFQEEGNGGGDMWENGWAMVVVLVKFCGVGPHNSETT